MSSAECEDVRRYLPAVDEAAVAAIVRHLGIALDSPAAAAVDCASSAQLARIRETWLKGKLGLRDTDAALDRAIRDVCAKMKADPVKSRVTFYYLLAARFGKLARLSI